MKKMIFILMAMVMLYGCEEKSKIEIVPNYNTEYYNVSDYERYSMNLIPEETQKEMQSDVYEIFKIIKSNDEIDNPYIYELYIDKGRVSKIQSEKEWNSKVDDKLVEKMSYWKFGKYVKDGGSQKYRIRFSFAVYHNTLTKKGNIKEERVNVVVYGNKAEEINKEIFFVVVEEMPSPIGGIKAIQKNIKYPEAAKMNGIQGRVYVKAYIDSAGLVVKTEIIKGIGAGCDKVAMEAVKKVKFIPGKQRGKPVNVQVTVPILFKLNGDGESKKKTVLEDKLLLKRIIPFEQNGLSKFSGKVVDVKTGMPIAAASINLDGTKLGGATNNNGEFSILKVPQGNYKVVVNNSTYGKHYLGTISLLKNKNTIVELRIKEFK
ncbi:MAG: TonB family protein [Melioribacteraceae bacterium]|nr:TonB family protein [Melioribacteraceae bacterium]